MSKLLILGAGGHGKVVADCALELEVYDEVAFLDDRMVGQTVLNECQVIGRFEDANRYISDFEEAIVALGKNHDRIALVRYLDRIGFRVPKLIHPAAHISRYATVEGGTFIAAGAIVNAGARVGVGCIINTCASVDHDCTLGCGVHLSPGARLGGAVTVGDYTWVCMGAIVANSVYVGEEAVVAAGAVVINDVCDRVLVAGVPAKERKIAGQVRSIVESRHGKSELSRVNI